jgi:hypothetical protein
MPYMRRMGAIWSARMAPMQNRTSATIGTLLTPTRSIWDQRFCQPRRRPRLERRAAGTVAKVASRSWVRPPTNSTKLRMWRTGFMVAGDGD